jgi:hypothetical protein
MNCLRQETAAKGQPKLSRRLLLSDQDSNITDCPESETYSGCRTICDRHLQCKHSRQLVFRFSWRDLDGLPGATPVKKFKDRKAAVLQICKHGLLPSGGPFKNCSGALAGLCSKSDWQPHCKTWGRTSLFKVVIDSKGSIRPNANKWPDGLAGTTTLASYKQEVIQRPCRR